MTNGTMIIKRDGTSEHLNIDKIHKVVMHACEGLAGVSSSQIEMNANLQFYDGMSTAEIQEILVRSANDLISLENPNYQFAASRLLSYGLYKQVFGEFHAMSFRKMINLILKEAFTIQKYWQSILLKKLKEWIRTCITNVTKTLLTQDCVKL